ncbi:Ribosome assembly protein 3 [Smittium culicis]|uniref:Ribosome assembly protein 3 n=1 Tax=Smittium culicis TaxID=133412 RepID=A0A1R1XPE7_9FUNG|nr:Ribosome assembly protein 3 [Smittium culicis]
MEYSDSELSANSIGSERANEDFKDDYSSDSSDDSKSELSRGEIETIDAGLKNIETTSDGIGLKHELLAMSKKDHSLKKLLEIEEEISHDNDESIGRSVVITNSELVGKLSEHSSLLEQEAKNGFQAIYMEAVTSAFGEELNKLRHSEQIDKNRLELLIDSLNAGAGIFSD